MLLVVDLPDLPSWLALMVRIFVRLLCTSPRRRSGSGIGVSGWKMERLLTSTSLIIWLKEGWET